jgi:hypothetical protein
MSRTTTECQTRYNPDSGASEGERRPLGDGNVLPNTLFSQFDTPERRNGKPRVPLDQSRDPESAAIYQIRFATRQIVTTCLAGYLLVAVP